MSRRHERDPQPLARMVPPAVSLRAVRERHYLQVCNDVRRMPTGCIDGSTLTTRGKGLLGALTICENIHTRVPQPIRRRLFFGHISEDTSRPNERRTEERHFYDP